MEPVYKAHEFDTWLIDQLKMNPVINTCWKIAHRSGFEKDDFYRLLITSLTQALEETQKRYEQHMERCVTPPAFKNTENREVVSNE